MASHKDMMAMNEEGILKLIKGEQDTIEPEVGAAYLEHKLHQRLIKQNWWLVTATWGLVVATIAMVLWDRAGN